ncbi:membrane protein insertase YidC [Parvularcula sp. ZS-1/3]|uniref:Membrane protein insertase YidC n=1 Tax=Parvularcula mediterranea TaxID=2732508 RepID=A0A7Y3W540_9PROT|nr:membrane protein insertase YidC [Parvularcula mediterranea]NNU16400.1 membrane protein insertase YidC [Parvularcula mediterranea]
MDRNFVVAIGLAFIILLGWDVLIAGPQREALEAAKREAGIEAAEAAGPSLTADLSVPTVDATLTRIEALKQAPGRVAIETPTMIGSLNLLGATLDDISLKNYRITPEDDAPLVNVLSPRSTETATFIRNGVIVDGQSDDQAVWTAPEGARLTPATPVTLSRQDGEVRHEMTITVDEEFMFTAEHKVINQGSGRAALLPYGFAAQKNLPDDLKNFMILFEGPLGVVDGQLFSKKYKKLDKSKNTIDEAGTGGWAGITDKYWLAAAIPPQDQDFDLKLTRVQGTRTPLYRASYQLDGFFLEPGQEATVTSRMFAGAKVVETLRGYEDGLGISDFDKAVDWGMLFFLTRPIFHTMHFFAELTGNYGVAILLLTLVVKALLFPLANASYRSMAGMRKVAPEMTRIRERYGDDKMKQQQEMMALYKKHKINPAAGCLPVLLQMPIFFALYKVLFTTIEIRHEGFLYIRDLAEQDPTNLFNLFGLLPYDPTMIPVVGAFLGIGILPLLMGAAMWVQTKLNPPPTDPIQAQVFGLLPLIFIFIFAPFAAGLVLYWFWNTFLGVVQQYFIMKRAGADVDIIGNIKQTFGKKPDAEKPAE